MKLHFRPAEVRDTEQAVPLIYSAGPEGFEYVFTQGRRSSLDYLRYTFPDGRGLFGYRNHSVVELDGKVVGIGAFYSGMEYNRLSQGTLQQVLHFYRFSSLSVLWRAMQTTRWMPPPGQRTLYVANLGVAPELRGKGIGARLLHEQMSRARANGKGKFALDVAVTNPRAQLLYEKLGLRVVAQSDFEATRNGIHMPQTRRMEVSL